MKRYGIINHESKNEFFLRAFIDEDQIFENIDLLDRIKYFCELSISQILLTKSLDKHKLELRFFINSSDQQNMVINLLETKGFINFNSVLELNNIEEENKNEITTKNLGFNDPMKPLFDELSKKILNQKSSIIESCFNYYVSYKISANELSNFLTIIPQKSNLKIDMRIPFEDLNDYKNKCRDISDIKTWGNGNSQLIISDFSELDYAMEIIRQAMNHAKYG